jgi:Tfp pilus assembly protein PilF
VDASHPQANLFAAKLYRLKGDNERALTLVRKAIQVTRAASSEAYSLLAEMLWSSGAFDEAQESFLNAVR